MKKPLRIAITGAAGQIGYALLFRICSGEMLGKDQPIILHLLEIPQALDALKGVVMELEDSAFPVLNDIVTGSDEKNVFRDLDMALLVGARPRGKGMERKDLIESNASIFTKQGKALNEYSKNTCKILVVGNPANTNAYITMKSAPNIPRENFTAMLRLDHNRALSQLSTKTAKPVGSIKNMIVWGNHSPTMYPDYRFCQIDSGYVKDMISDNSWYKDFFIPKVAKRGSEVIEARGLSSAASAANAAIDHMHDWFNGSNGNWVTMGVPSNGEYDVPNDIIFGFPCLTENGSYKIIDDIELDDFSKMQIQKTLQELIDEKNAIDHLL